jgi:hypothetical protein
MTRIKYFYPITLPLFLLFIAFGSAGQTYAVAVMAPEGGTWGYCNEKGALFIPTNFRSAGEFSEDGWAVAQLDNNQYVFLGIAGTRLSGQALGISKVKGGFHDGLLAVRIGYQWGYLNTSGKIVIPARYENTVEFQEGFAAASRDSKYYILNTSGEETPIVGSPIALIRHFTERLAPFDNGTHLGFISAEGKVAIQPIYKGVGYFNDGIAWARDDDSGMIGFLNTKGEWVFQPQFSYVVNPHPDSRWVRCKREENWMYVNSVGQELIVRDTEAWGDFANGLAPGKKNGAWGFFDTSGKWIIEPRFDGVRDFQKGFAAVKKKGRWGMIDRSGNWIIQPVWGGIKDMASVH